jgi:transcriptional regulator with XRE-family HTH domain
VALGRRLRELRAGRDLTLEQAAELMGIHPRHLQRLETGRANVTLATLVAACVMYDVTLGSIFAGIDWKPPA